MKNIERIYEFLKKCGTYYIATVEGNQARVRPFGTINLYNGKLYIQTGKSKKVSEQLKQNPNIEISAMLNDKWIRVSCQAVLDDNYEARVKMLEAYPELKSMYKPNDGNTEVYYLKKGEAQICSFDKEPKTFKF